MIEFQIGEITAIACNKDVRASRIATGIRGNKRRQFCPMDIVSDQQRRVDGPANAIQ